YNGVTVITHGLEVGGAFLALGDEDFHQPTSMMELARLIAAASGGGVVLRYEKSTGQWVDEETGLTGLAALQPGKAVVLVSDWVKESAVSETGFSEAAADALFASLIALDRATLPANAALGTPGAILQSHLHFIGWSRGASVTGEIVQRMGTY